jgi:hypothetical protein
VGLAVLDLTIQVIGEPGETPMAGFRQLAEQLSAEAAR